MRYLYKRGPGASRRVFHLSGYDPRTGEPLLTPICGRDYGIRFDTTINVPLGQRLCRRCKKEARADA